MGILDCDESDPEEEPQDYQQSRKCALVASNLKCKRMADQMEPTVVEFLRMVILEITGQ